MEPVSWVDRAIRRAISLLARRETEAIAALLRGRATQPAAKSPRRSRSTHLTGGISRAVRALEPESISDCDRYQAGQKVRRGIEELFGWLTTVAGLRRTRYRGCSGTHLMVKLGAAVYGLSRIRRLDRATRSAALFDTSDASPTPGPTMSVRVRSRPSTSSSDGSGMAQGALQRLAIPSVRLHPARYWRAIGVAGKDRGRRTGSVNSSPKGRRQRRRGPSRAGRRRANTGIRNRSESRCPRRRQ